MVELWVPTLPPIPAITGMNNANTGTEESAPSKPESAAATSTPPSAAAASHGMRTRKLVQNERVSNSSSPAPAILRMSSVASSRMTSTISSMVTIPTMRRCSSTTGIAIRS
jgi:hypothetical protein